MSERIGRWTSSLMDNWQCHCPTDRNYVSANKLYCDNCGDFRPDHIEGIGEHKEPLTTLSEDRACRPPVKALPYPYIPEVWEMVPLSPLKTAIREAYATLPRNRCPTYDPVIRLGTLDYRCERETGHELPHARDEVCPGYGGETVLWEDES